MSISGRTDRHKVVRAQMECDSALKKQQILACDHGDGALKSLPPAKWNEPAAEERLLCDPTDVRFLEASPPRHRAAW